MQLLNVLLYQPLLKDSSLTLPTTHLIMSWALWPLMPVNLGLFWTSPWGDLRWELVWMIWKMMQRECLIDWLQDVSVSLLWFTITCWTFCHLITNLFSNAAIICKPLFTYPHVIITYHHETPSSSYGTRAQYVVSCPPELERIGGDDARTCTANGNSAVGVWSGAAPICAGLQCK